MKTVFKSKVDFWLAALVYGVLLILVVALILEFDVVVFGIMVLTVAFVSGVLFGIRYVLENETLTVSVCGIRHGRYDLKKMTSVKKNTHAHLLAGIFARSFTAEFRKAKICRYFSGRQRKIYKHIKKNQSRCGYKFKLEKLWKQYSWYWQLLP